MLPRGDVLWWISPIEWKYLTDDGEQVCCDTVVTAKLGWMAGPDDLCINRLKGHIWGDTGLCGRRSLH